MENFELEEKKKQMRQQMRFVRNNLTLEEREAQNKVITELILGTELYQSARFILTYVSYASEVDTRVLMGRAIKDGKKVYVPKVMGDKMDFFQVEDPAKLVPNKMGIPEPEADPVKLFPYTTHLSLDSSAECMILVPGLAFDAKLNRIGYGAGYYDRYLASFRKKMAVGLAYKEQIVDEVPVGETDEPLDLVVTPERAYY